MLREGAWLREQGLEPRFFCGGGWYTDSEVMAAVADLGYVDCTATAWRPSYLPPGSPRAELDQPAWVRLVDGRRLLELPTTHSLGAIARSLHPKLPPVVHVHFHDYELLDAPPARRARRDAAPARTAPATGRARRAHRRPRGSLARRMRGLKLRRLVAAAALAALAGCGGSHHPSRAISLQIDTNPFRITILRDGKTVVTEDEHARLRYQLASTGDQYFLTKVISKQGDTYRVATSEPGGRRTATVKVTQTATGADVDLALHPGTGVQQVYDAFDSAPHEHFLGGGENDEAVDLHGQILGVEVGYQCSYTPIPFFASSAGWGLRLASQNPAAMAFAGSPGGDACQIATTTRPARSRRSPRERRSASRAPSCTSTSTSARSPRRSPTTWPRRASPWCRRPPSSS